MALFLAKNAVFILRLRRYFGSLHNFLLFFNFCRFFNNLDDKGLILFWRIIINLFLYIVVQSVNLFYFILDFWLFCIYNIILKFLPLCRYIPFYWFFPQVFTGFLFLLLLFFRRFFAGEVVLFRQVWVCSPGTSVIWINFSLLTRWQISWRQLSKLFRWLGSLLNTNFLIKLLSRRRFQFLHLVLNLLQFRWVKLGIPLVFNKLGQIFEPFSLDWQRNCLVLLLQRRFNFFWFNIGHFRLFDRLVKGRSAPVWFGVHFLKSEIFEIFLFDMWVFLFDLFLLRDRKYTYRRRLLRG